MPLHRTHARSRTAYTLIELVLAVSLTALIVGGIASVLTVTARGSPDANGFARASASASGAVASLTDELRYATSVTALSDRAVQFTFPDRTGDGVAEVVGYEWSGVAGSPLHRTFNGVGSDVITRVQSFQLTRSEVASSGLRALAAVEVSLQTAGSPSVTIRTTVRLLNAPTPPS